MWGILQDVVVLLAASLFLGGLVSRVGQSPLIGFLLAGMLLGGPGSFGWIHSPHEIESIAELGVALLLFSLGLEFSWQRLRKLGMKSLWGGVAQVTLTLLATVLVTWPFGLPWKTSLALGAMLSLSSTAVVLRILMERAELEMLHGRNCLAVLLTQDIAVVPLALLMTILGGEGGPREVAWQAGRIVFFAGLLVLALVVLNQVAVRALGMLTLQRNRELTVIFAAVTGLGAAWSAHAVGISPALGAFVAGMLLGSSPFATQIRADISTLRVLLLTLFFSAAGMVADPRWMLEHWGLILLTTTAITVGKLLVIWIIFRWLGQPTRVAAATGFCLAQIGEFAFVLGSIGKTSGVITDDLYSLVISCAILSFALSAFMVPAAGQFGNWVCRCMGGTRTEETAEGGDPADPDIVLIGFGPSGQAVGRTFQDQGLTVGVIELNSASVALAKSWGFQAEVGDATQMEVLEHAKIPLCRAVVITIPHHRSALTILDNVRHLAPHAFIVARSRYRMFSDDFAARGVVVVGDEERVGTGLAEELQRWLEQTRQVDEPGEDRSVVPPTDRDAAV